MSCNLNAFINLNPTQRDASTEVKKFNKVANVSVRNLFQNGFIHSLPIFIEKKLDYLDYLISRRQKTNKIKSKINEPIFVSHNNKVINNRKNGRLSAKINLGKIIKAKIKQANLEEINFMNKKLSPRSNIWKKSKSLAIIPKFQGNKIIKIKNNEKIQI